MRNTASVPTGKRFADAFPTSTTSPARNPGAIEVLLDLAAEVGLDVEQAREVLATDAYAQEVREAEQFWQRAGINSVPAIIINEHHLISGGQPPEVFEQALRQIAAQT